MKRVFAILCALSLATTLQAQSAPTFFAGLSFVVGPIEAQPQGSSAKPSWPKDRSGVTLKLLSTDKSNAVAGSIGVTRYFDGTFGCDIGATYIQGSNSVAAGYDMCRRLPVFGVGSIVKP